MIVAVVVGATIMTFDDIVVGSGLADRIAPTRSAIVLPQVDAARLPLDLPPMPSGFGAG
jgi:hypothetical protein